MSVRLKLVIIVLFVALVPLIVSAFTGLRIHRRAFDHKVSQLHRATADNGALLSSAVIDGATRNIAAAARAIPWASASPEERDGAMWLLFRQLDDIAAVSLFDVRQASVAPSAFIDGPTEDGAYSAHPTVSTDTLTRFYQAIPFGQVGAEPQVGRTFSSAGGDTFIPVVIQVPGGAEPLIVAVAVSLRSMCDDVAGIGDLTTDIHVVDSDGRDVCRTPLSRMSSVLLDRLADAGAVPFSYGLGEREILASVAPIGRGWKVIAQQPLAIASAASSRMQMQTLFWVVAAALAALGAGLLLARGISRPVRVLVRGAREIAGGNLGYRVDVEGRDELARLASAFNQMSEEIEQRNSEIEAFNEELQARVDERTQQLKDAQQQLLRSQKIAAVSSLAAGVAHEINNPLTGVLGLAQVLKVSAERGEPSSAETLAHIETEAKRIRDIVQTMLDLSEGRGTGSLAQIDLREPLDRALERVASRIQAHDLELVADVQDELPRVSGNSGQLRQVFEHLLNNAIAASDDGGTIELTISVVEGPLVEVRLTDHGRGIPPEHLERVFEPFFTTKEEWGGRGLGLAVSYRIVEQHSGSIAIASTVGQGTTVTMTLPTTAGGAHLV